ncbi:MAG TPA: type II toxin-antitoxin system VapB family antitoxin [Dehalococcoidia bacterium]|nr:type II toxin-antitoxin system VapB family antitoxin [Dehalococcoidia bacterium]
MRTTIRLDDQLLREAKSLAAETGGTLTSVIEDALRETLARRSHQAEREPVRLPTMPGRLLPGVDLDDSASLLDLMESSDGPPRR